MIDSDLVSKLLECDSKGKDGIQEMRDLLKQEGGISRLLGIAERVIKKPVRAKKPKQAALDILPPWLPLTEWNAYVKMRDRIKAPLTDEAKVLTFNKLEKFKTDGMDPAAVLMQSVQAAYRGVFPLRAETNSGTNVVPIYEPPRNPADAVTRLEIFYGKSPDCDAGTWTPKWGPNPDDPNCRISAESRTAFQAKHGPRRAQQ